MRLFPHGRQRHPSSLAPLFLAPAVFFFLSSFRFVSLHLSASSFLPPPPPLAAPGDVNCEPDVQSGINQSRRVKGSRDEREGGREGGRGERRKARAKDKRAPARPTAKSQIAD